MDNTTNINNELDQYGVWIKTPPHNAQTEPADATFGQDLNENTQNPGPQSECSEEEQNLSSSQSTENLSDDSPVEDKDNENNDISLNDFSAPDDLFTDDVSSFEPAVEENAGETETAIPSFDSAVESSQGSVEIPEQEPIVSESIEETSADVSTEISLEHQDADNGSTDIPVPDFPSIDVDAMEGIDLDALANEFTNLQEGASPVEEPKANPEPEAKTVSTSEEVKVEDTSLSDLADGEVSLDSFFSDAPDGEISVDSFFGGESSFDGNMQPDGDISLDAFLDVSDFGLGPENQENVAENFDDPLDIDLTFEDTVVEEDNDDDMDFNDLDSFFSDSSDSVDVSSFESSSSGVDAFDDFDAMFNEIEDSAPKAEKKLDTSSVGESESIDLSEFGLADEDTGNIKLVADEKPKAPVVQDYELNIDEESLDSNDIGSEATEDNVTLDLEEKEPDRTALKQDEENPFSAPDSDFDVDSLFDSIVDETATSPVDVPKTEVKEEPLALPSDETSPSIEDFMDGDEVVSDSINDVVDPEDLDAIQKSETVEESVSSELDDFLDEDFETVESDVPQDENQLAENNAEESSVDGVEENVLPTEDASVFAPEDNVVDFDNFGTPVAEEAVAESTEDFASESVEEPVQENPTVENAILEENFFDDIQPEEKALAESEIESSQNENLVDESSTVPMLDESVDEIDAPTFDDVTPSESEPEETEKEITSIDVPAVEDSVEENEETTFDDVVPSESSVEENSVAFDAPTVEEPVIHETENTDLIEESTVETQETSEEEFYENSVESEVQEEILTEPENTEAVVQDEENGLDVPSDSIVEENTDNVEKTVAGEESASINSGDEQENSFQEPEFDDDAFDEKIAETNIEEDESFDEPTFEDSEEKIETIEEIEIPVFNDTSSAEQTDSEKDDEIPESEIITVAEEVEITSETKDLDDGESAEEIQEPCIEEDLDEEPSFDENNEETINASEEIEIPVFDDENESTESCENEPTIEEPAIEESIEATESPVLEDDIAPSEETSVEESEIAAEEPTIDEPVIEDSIGETEVASSEDVAPSLENIVEDTEPAFEEPAIEESIEATESPVLEDDIAPSEETSVEESEIAAEEPTIEEPVIEESVDESETQAFDEIAPTDETVVENEYESTESEPVFDEVIDEDTEDDVEPPEFDEPAIEEPEESMVEVETPVVDEELPASEEKQEFDTIFEKAAFNGDITPPEEFAEIKTSFDEPVVEEPELEENDEPETESTDSVSAFDEPTEETDSVAEPILPETSETDEEKTVDENLSLIDSDEPSLSNENLMPEEPATEDDEETFEEPEFDEIEEDSEPEFDEVIIPEEDEIVDAVFDDFESENSDGDIRKKDDNLIIDINEPDARQSDLVADVQTESTEDSMSDTETEADKINNNSEEIQISADEPVRSADVPVESSEDSIDLDDFMGSEGFSDPSICEGNRSYSPEELEEQKKEAESKESEENAESHVDAADENNESGVDLRSIDSDLVVDAAEGGTSNDVLEDEDVLPPPFYSPLVENEGEVVNYSETDEESSENLNETVAENSNKGDNGSSIEVGNPPENTEEDAGEEQMDSTNTSEEISETASLISQIAKELSALRNEINELKTEFAEIRNGNLAVKSADAENALPKEEPEAESGFFSDMDDDDTIALSGDELSNILSSAEFTPAEEQGENLFGSVDGSVAVPEQDYENNLKMDFDNENLEEPNLDSVQLANNEAVAESEEEVSNEVPKVDDVFVESSDSEYMSAENASDEIVLEQPSDGYATPELTDSLDAHIDNSISQDDYDYLAEDSEAVNQEDDESIEEGISEEPVDNVFSAWGASGSTEEETSAVEAGEVKEAPVPSEEPVESVDTVAEPQASGSIPENMKQEIKSVLAYMDQLLESLPEDKIAEFAQSEQFSTYKKLFTELGLS